MSTFQLILPILQATVTVALAFLAGIASCLALWVIPIIRLPANTSRSAIAQFDEVIYRGGTYLQPTSRAIAASLVIIALLTSQHPDPSVAAKWKYYVASGVVIAQVAWYEIVFIFPINRQISAMGGKFEGRGKATLTDREKRMLADALDSWVRFHWIRALLPLAGAVIAVAALL